LVVALVEQQGGVRCPYDLGVRHWRKKIQGLWAPSKAHGPFLFLGVAGITSAPFL